VIGRLMARAVNAVNAANTAEATVTGHLPLVDRVRDELVDRDVLRPSPDDIAGVVGAMDVPGVEQVRILTREFSGLGDLAIPLGDPEVTDVLVNGPGPVWVDRGRGVEPTDLRVRDEAACRALAVRLAAACGARLDDARPYADGVLTDLPPGVAAAGVRVHAVLAPPAGAGACVSLRALSRSHRDLGALQETGMFPEEGARLLDTLVTGRRSFLVSGGTGSGKTTLLAALLSRVPAHERLLLVEDTPELLPDHPHVVRLHTRDAGADGAGAVDMRTLVRQSLRMRPDRIIVGEIRGAEIAELLLAFNTGHGGSAGTLHANSLSAVPGRLTALGALAGMPAESVARQVVDGVDTVVHLHRSGGRRHLAQIGRLSGAGGVLRVEPVWERSW
jgi:pilus assembly protein CpaF